MRAYLAVLKDSFREALASRVLWILLALTTLVLAALAPIGISEKPATQLRQSSILNMSALVSKIETQGRAISRQADLEPLGRRSQNAARESRRSGGRKCARQPRLRSGRRAEQTS